MQQQTYSAAASSTLCFPLSIFVALPATFEETWSLFQSSISFSDSV
jgi:hypothetical protein